MPLEEKKISLKEMVFMSNFKKEGRKDVHLFHSDISIQNIHPMTIMTNFSDNKQKKFLTCQSSLTFELNFTIHVQNTCAHKVSAL